MYTVQHQQQWCRLITLTVHDKKKLNIIGFARKLCIVCRIWLQWLRKLLHCILLSVRLNWERPPLSYFSNCIVGVKTMQCNQRCCQHSSCPTKTPVTVHSNALQHTYTVIRKQTSTAVLVYSHSLDIVIQYWFTAFCSLFYSLFWFWYELTRHQQTWSVSRGRATAVVSWQQLLSFFLNVNVHHQFI